MELFIKHLTLDEKIAWLSTRMSTPRLGMPMLGCYEGLHGLALGGPSHNNGRITVDGKQMPNDLPTTIFPQAYGMGATWSPELIRRIGDIEAEEARWYVQRPEARRKGLVIYAPNADLARDPRWGQPLYPFGFGLSYTRFKYGQARVAKQDKQKIVITVPVTNTGDCDGEEVVQLYANLGVRQLKAFQRVMIPKGQTRDVELEVAREDLSHWDAASHAFKPVTGTIRCDIGASSADIRTSVVF